jgi:osmoprotectant transport system substrate-binding protein
MRSTVSARANGNRLRRGGGIAATLATVAVAATACGSSGSSSPASSSSAPSSSSASASAGSSGNSSSAKLPAGTPGKGKPTITLGDKNFAEEYILGALYQQALQAKGFTVTLKGNIGGSEIIDTAFKSNQIQVYPEYTGEIVSTVAGKPLPTSAAATYSEAKAFEQASRSGTILTATPFYDKNVIIVKTSFAQQHHLTSIGDLANVGAKGKGVTVGGPPEDRTRYEGLVGMQKAYGLTGVAYKGYAIGAYYTALNQGSINAALGGSTDAQLSSKSLTVLTDPKAIFGFQYVVPVVKQSLLKSEGPAFAQTLNWVDSLLTLPAMRAMDSAVENAHDNPATVAKQFLSANGLS